MTKILIVEDESIIAMELEDRLVQFDYAVTGIAASAEAAFRSIEKEKPDIILMDIRIQGAMDGIETAERVHARFDIPVIYLTAFADETTIQRAKATGPFAYIVKPFKEDELRAAIEIALYKHEIDMQLQEKQRFIEQIAFTMPDIVYVIDLQEGKSVFMNRAMVDILGYTLEDVRTNKLNFTDLVHLDDLNAIINASRQVAEAVEGSVIEVEYRMKHANGDWRWMHSRNTALKYDADGRVKQFLGVAQDITEQKQRIAALYESEAQFRRVVENINDALIVDDVNGYIVFANSQFLDLLGFQREELPNIVLEDYVAAEYRAEMRERHNRRMRGEGVPTRFEFQGIHRDKRRLWLEANVVPVRGENGDLTGSQSVIRDITSRKEAEGALRESQARFEGVVSTAFDAIVSINEEQDIILFNNGAERVFGWPAKDVIGQPLDILLPGETIVPHRRLVDNLGMVEDVAARHMNEGYEVCARRRDGSMFPVEVSVSKTTVQGSNIYTAILRDITERRQAEDDIRRLNRELEERVKDRTRELEQLNSKLEIRVLERTADLQSANILLAALEKAAIVVNQSLDLEDVLDQILEQARMIIPCRGINLMFIEGDYAYISRRIGYEGFGQLERNLMDFQYPLSWPTFDYMMKNGRSILISNTVGHPRWHDSSMTEWVRSFIGLPLIVEKSVVGFLNASHDEPEFFDEQHVTVLDALATHASLAIQKARLIEELRVTLGNEQKMRNQLVQADKLVALGKMVAVIAHEINNPIQTIKNTFYLLDGQVKQNQNAMEYLQIAKTEANRIAELVEQLRETYRPRSKTFTQLDLSKLLAEVKVVLDPQMKKKQVNWIDRDTIQPCKVLGNPNSLKQVFINICLNAVEAMEAEGGGDLVIDFQIGPDKRRIGVEVKNTGPQIPESILPHLFEPFFTTKGVGTGLGLSISYEIIRQHNGEIAVKNNFNRNVSFIIWLPLVTQAKEAGKS